MDSLKLALMCCLTLLTTFTFADVQSNGSKEEFPRKITIEYQGTPVNLQLTGEATRKKFFVSVYDVAHYLQEGVAIAPGSKFQDILNARAVKELAFKWVRTVEAAKVKEGYEESFKKTLSPNEYTQLQNQIEQFLGFYDQGVTKGDEQALRWFPDGKIEVIIKGNSVGTINNPAFAKALWSIWFGDKPVVDREKLVSLLKK